MNESNSKPISEQPFESKDNSASESPSQLLEKAVNEAQYMLSYAAGKCDEKIEEKTILPLLRVRRLLNQGKKIDPEVEAKFWLAYQELWELVKPATAETIIADLPLVGTLSSKPVAKSKATSKSNQAVNWYTRLTIICLLFLLAFQVYWVIGNQLTTQLSELLEKGTTLGIQLSENQKEYSTIEVLYKLNESENFKASGKYTFYSSPEWERDTLDNVSTKAQLEAGLESLKSQMERNYAILSLWSKPWDWIIQKNEITTNDKYSSQIAKISSQIETINKQKIFDNSGKRAADALNSTVSPQLKVIDDQLGKLYARNDEYDLQEAAIQRKIQEIDDQLTALAGDDNARRDSESTLQAQLNAAGAQLTNLDAVRVVIQGQRDEINNQLNVLRATAEADPNQIAALDQQLNELDAQLTALQENIAAVEEQEQEINNQLNAIQGDEAARQSRESDLALQSNELKAQVTDLAANKAVTGDQIQSLQAQSNDLVSQLVSSEQIVNQREQDLAQLTDEKNALESQKLVEEKREESRQAQLAGQFVLNILQGYVLPLLYGMLGAATYVLRNLSKQIEDVVYSDKARIQHTSRIVLGALAGIMVGWFSFLIPSETTSFLGSVSPLAIAFLVGYNIEIFFSLMDIPLNKLTETLQRPAPPSEKDHEADVPPGDSSVPPASETPSEEEPVVEEASG